MGFDEAGTTRDSINMSFEKLDKHYTIIDTAGSSRRGKVYEKIDTKNGSITFLFN